MPNDMLKRASIYRGMRGEGLLCNSQRFENRSVNITCRMPYKYHWHNTSPLLKFSSEGPKKHKKVSVPSWT